MKVSRARTRWCWGRNRHGKADEPARCVLADCIIHIVRTNIMIDDELMAETLRATGITTKREAVETGLRTLLRLSRQAEIRRFRGKLKWDGDLDQMRRDR
jgi:Arc/MetJ family transcription regulator